MRDLKAEAAEIAGPNVLVRVRESKKATFKVWGAWEVHIKHPCDKRGKCVVTLVHLNNTVFEAPQPY